MSKKTSSNPVSTIFYFGAAYFAFQTFQGAFSFAAGITGMVILGAIGSFIHAAHVENVQEKRTDEASRIMKLIRSDEESEIPQYYVYLRPFITTSEMPVDNSENGILPGPEAMLPSGYQSKSFDMEERIADSLVDSGHLVGLGHPGEAVGAGRLPTEEHEWKAAVLELIVHANHLFIVPGAQEGTMWEITEILNRGFIENSTFVVPPKPEHETKKFSWSLHFEQLKNEFEKIGLQIPDFDQAGIIFRYNDANEVIMSEKIPPASPKDKDLEKLLLKIVSGELNSNSRKVSVA